MSLGGRGVVEVVIVFSYDLITSNNDLTNLELSFLQKLKSVVVTF